VVVEESEAVCAKAVELSNRREATKKRIETACNLGPTRAREYHTPGVTTEPPPVGGGREMAAGPAPDSQCCTQSAGAQPQNTQLPHRLPPAVLITLLRRRSCGDLFRQSLRRPRIHDVFGDVSYKEFGCIVIVPALILVVVSESGDDDRTVLGVDDCNIVSHFVE